MNACRRLRDFLSQPHAIFFWHLCPECLSLPGVALLGGLGNGRAEDVAEGDEVLVLETPRGVLWGMIKFVSAETDLSKMS